MNRERIDSWNPFDTRPRKSPLQEFYVGMTLGSLFWALLLLAWLIGR